MAGQTKIAILMGSQSDWKVMKKACAVLDELGVGHEEKIISAHRKPERLGEYVSEAEQKGIAVFIAGAGLAAHLPGAIASKTTKPVLGVPMDAGSLKGMDALLSIVQMPPGIPVGTLGIGSSGAKNAGLLAAQILAISDPDLAARLTKWRADAAASLPEDPERD